jgi:integrase
MVASMNCLSDAVGMTSDNGTGRRRGSIRQRGGSLQVRVFAGQDPVTQRERYLSETVKGTDRAAHRKAEKALTRLQAAADRNRVPDHLRAASACVVGVAWGR